MTGIDDNMKQNFNTMKELAQATNKQANEAMKVIQDIVKQLSNAKDEVFKHWGVTFAEKPKELECSKLPAGNWVMGNDKKIALDVPGKNLERETQAQFFENPSLDCWAVFYMEGKDKVYNDFIGNF